MNRAIPIYYQAQWLKDVYKRQPFRRVDKETGVVLDEVVYMTADVEDDYVVAQANEPLDEEGRFARKTVNARCRDEFIETEPKNIDFMGVSPRMVVSVATAMIDVYKRQDIGKSFISKTDNGDGTITWKYAIAIGSKGDRIVTVMINEGEDWIYGTEFNVKIADVAPVEPVAAEIYSASLDDGVILSLIHI